MKTKLKVLEYPQNLLYDVFDEEISLPDDYMATVEYVLSTKLSARQKAMVKSRYQEKYTYQETGEWYGLTRERIRQITEKSVRRLRHPKTKDILKYGIAGTINRLEKALKGSTSKPESNALPDPERDISYVNFDVRTFNCLRRSRIYTVEDILKLTPDELMHIKNLGRKSYLNIVETLETEGYDASKFKI